MQQAAWRRGTTRKSTIQQLYLPFLFSSQNYTTTLSSSSATSIIKDESGTRTGGNDPNVVFVLGGPGCGKGTQCAKLAEAFGFFHISSGELLRKEMSSNSEKGEMMREILKDGRIIPSEITVSLMQKEMEASGSNKFLIDGFPRNNQNRIAFKHIIRVEPKFVLYLSCPEEELVRRVLNRNQGRMDDTADILHKRLMSFRKVQVPVLKYYHNEGTLAQIDGVGTVEEVFRRVEPLFLAYKDGETRMQKKSN